MRVGSLFAGIGGIELGLEVHGLTTAWQVESDPYAGLWFEYARAIRTLRPQYVFVENVRALVVRGLDIVVGDLAALGYDARWTCLRASDVGAPHRRERLFLVATPATDADHAERRADDPRRRDMERERGLPGGRVEGDGAAGGRGGVAATDASGAERGGPQLQAVVSPRRAAAELGERPSAGAGSSTADWGQYAAAIRRWERTLGRPAPAPLDERGRLNPDLAEWMMGFPDGWTEGKRTDRLRCYGNAVVPQCATTAWSLLTAPPPVEVHASRATLGAP